MEPAPLRLHLIRHGETAWSLTGQHTGCTDLALTARGREQARSLEPVLGVVRFDHVLSSPARRASETCALAGLGGAAEVEPDLAEWDYGDYEGRTTDDIRREAPGWSVFRDGCPGGESVAAVTARADRLILRCAALRGNVALFSSGQFGCCLAARWIGLAVVEARRLMLATASISVLAYNPAHPDLRVIDRWNQPAAGLLEQPVCKAALHGFAAENEARMAAMSAAADQITSEPDRFEGTLRGVRRKAITAGIIELGTGAAASDLVR